LKDHRKYYVSSPKFSTFSCTITISFKFQYSQTSLKPEIMQNTGYSSASSVIDMDPGEGILIQDIDAETDQTDTEDVEINDKVFVSTSTSDDQKQLLRDKLRSLTQRTVQPG
jgi:hypothetical protein